MKFNFLLLIIISLFFSCSHKLTPGEGYIKVTGGKVWYKVSGQGNKDPILLLHGGPGGSSYYLRLFTALNKDRSVILLDQLGGGRSERITDTSLMDIKYFVKELNQVRKKLHLKNYYLYGHSWGTMLGIDYYLKYPKGIKALIFNSPLFSTDRWIKDADTLIATLPTDIQTTIRENEKNKTYNSEGYQKAMTIYYQNFMHRMPMNPVDRDTIGSFGENVYEYMWGPSEFTATGNLKNYDRLNSLSKIKVPTLLICGEYDEARPTTVKYYQSLIPGSGFIMIPNSGHGTMVDDPKANLQAVSNFIDSLESK